MLSKEYLAGFFDGEGSVTIHCSVKSNGHSLRIAIAQKHPYVLARILVEYPEFTLVKGSPRSGVYYIHGYGRNTKRFLKDIFPFLIVKKKQVELALCFIELQYGTAGSQGIGEENLQERQKIIEALREDKDSPQIN